MVDLAEEQMSNSYVGMVNFLIQISHKQSSQKEGSMIQLSGRCRPYNFQAITGHHHSFALTNY